MRLKAGLKRKKNPKQSLRNECFGFFQLLIVFTRKLSKMLQKSVLFFSNFVSRSTTLLQWPWIENYIFSKRCEHFFSLLASLFTRWRASTEIRDYHANPLINVIAKFNGDIFFGAHKVCFHSIFCERMDSLHLINLTLIYHESAII